MLMEIARSRAAPSAMRYYDEPNVLDEAHLAIWHAVSHLFPAHALVTQTDYGRLLVSWRVKGPSGSTQFAAPVLIRLDAGLLLALWTCDAPGREEIAHEQADTVREHLAGHDPLSRIPTCPVIVLGE